MLISIRQSSTMIASKSWPGRPPAIHAAVGVHPNYASQVPPDDWDRVAHWARTGRGIALGETGLDRHWDYTPFDVQQDYFARHLELSRETGLPFIVHCRESEADVLAMLRDAHRSGPLNGVMHSYCGDAALAQECLAMGMYISFAGMVTFKKSQALREVAATIPADRILVETDSPYLSPHPLRGKRNEPANVRITAECVAAARGESFEALAAQTTQNAQRLFRLL
jgi:TatD DNase family protein